MLWIILAFLMIGTVCVITIPFFSASRESSGTEASVYVAQLKEIDREETLGLVPGEDALLARLEIKRRLARTREILPLAEESPMRRSDQITLVALASILAVGSALIYVTVGAPASPSAPAPTPMTAFQPKQSGAGMNTLSKSVGSVDDMLGKLEARLADEPDDVDGWRMLGWSRFRTGDVEGARQAYQKAVELVPDDANTLSALGETQVRAAGGLVTAEAFAVLQKAVQLQPNDPRARFLLGLKKEQDGDVNGALGDWISLLKSAQPGDVWSKDVRSRIIELSQSSGIDISADLPDAVPVTPVGPSDQDLETTNEMSADERQAMIEGMVARLDQKLRDDPASLEGWVRLIKARRVLGQDGLAADAVARAKAAFAASPQDLQTIDAAATSPLDIPLR